MSKDTTNTNTAVDTNDGSEALVELVDYLYRLEHSAPLYPKWAKFDTADTMSDNRGDAVIF